MVDEEKKRVTLKQKAKVASIKDSILEFMGDKKLSFKEIYQEFSQYKKHDVSNWMASLRNVGLVDLIVNDKVYLDNKYVKISDKTFTETISERLWNNNQKRVQGYYEKQNQFKKHPHGKIYLMDDFEHRSKGNKSKISAWSGYTSFSESI